MIKIWGEKIKDKEPKNIEDNIFNSREYGRFSLEIPLKTEDYLLSIDKPSFESKKGVFILEYNIAKKEDKRQLILTEDDDI